MIMTTLSPSDARSQIVDIIDDAVHHALGLKESLEDERKALEKQDMDAIHMSVENKSACVEALRKLDQKRDELCQSLGFASGDEQMSRLVEWCDDGGVINNRWQRLMVIAAESHALNMTNGAIIRVRQQQSESSLSVLRGVTPGSDTYSRSGAEFGDYGRRSLAEA